MPSRLVSAITLAVVAVSVAACGREPALFVEQNARAHVERLAGTIGNRPVGTPANAQAREYIVDQLRQWGYTVRVQETDARRPDIGRTARVANIIAFLPGVRREAYGLVSHYDSAYEAPGAGDAAFGVAVALEAGRVLAGPEPRQWSVLVLLTDGEEVGLMGAAAAMTDPEVAERLRAYVNLEAIGAAEPALLFQTGPANHWIVRPWARHAPHPRGASYSERIYERLPRDTDFSIIRRYEIPGLNFAAVGDTYAYHTARDTPERLSPRLLRRTGENVVAIARALDRTDITQRTTSQATYFDVGGTIGLTYGEGVGWIVTILGLILGALAWVKVTAAAIRTAGIGRWVFTALWALVGLAAVVGVMVGATWALRAVREVYHPWYARPGRLFLLLLAAGIATAWAITRAGEWLPARVHGVRHPVVTWSLALPVWLALGGAALWLVPAAAFVWTVPLLVAGLALLIVPVRSDPGVRLASVVILGAAATFWLGDIVLLLHFLVGVLGTMPIVTPVFVYAAVIALAGVMLAPPFVAAVLARRPLLRPQGVTAICLLGVAITAILAYMAPAYTFEQPLRRAVRALQDGGAPHSVWEVGSTEPGLDLEAGAPLEWGLARGPVEASIPWGRLPHPFVFRATLPPLGPPPATVTAFAAEPVVNGAELRVALLPHLPSLVVTFQLPEGIEPARTNLPGVRRGNRWAATYVAPAPEGVEWQASFFGMTPEALRAVRVTIVDRGLPGGEGWQRLPAWLPQERTVWTASSTWVLAPGESPPPLEPVPPLR